MSLAATIGGILHRAALYPALLVVQGLAIAFLLGARFPRKWLSAFAGLAIAFFVVRAATGLAVAQRDWDTEVFWYGGKAILEGRDPYAPNPTPWIALNPPSAFPLFAAFALLPLPVLCAAWRAANVLGSLAIVPLAARALREQGASAGDPGPAIPPEVVTVTTLALLFSTSCIIGFEAGQLATLATLGIIGGLLAQARGRPILAGALLAVATIKVTMMIPFLLLFLRRRDWKTWAALIVVGLGLSLATQSPAEFPGRIRDYLHLLREHNAEGGFNDYSFAGPFRDGLVAVDHTLYRLGMRDRGAIAAAQVAVLLALGAAVARAVAFRPRMPRMAAVSLVSIFSCMFLYHRYYDLVLLAIPLVYAATRARETAGLPRALYAGCGVSILVAINLLREPLARLLEISYRAPAPAGWMIQAFLLPYAFWMVALALVCLWAAERAVRPPAPAPAA